jgi:glycine/D-amino acid oxidase-like deaminating enzyme
MTTQIADVVICGAGIAGLSAAYHLTVKCGLKNVVIVDERPPLTLTSDKSTECYRNWWPGPGEAMVSLTNRSIDMLESLAYETNNRIQLNRRGYLYATADPARIPTFKHAAEEAAALGAGPARYYTGQPGDPTYIPGNAEGFENQPTGADVIMDQKLIRQHFPYLAENTIAVAHARRCGWFSGQQLGMYWLEQAQAHEAKLISAHLDGVDMAGGRVQGVRLSGKSGPLTISTPTFVNAAGPYITNVAQMLGVELPIFSELHIKVSVNDHLGVVGREAPLIIWTDPVYLPWSNEEREMLAEEPETQFLLEQFPAGVHARPDGPADSPVLLILWTYDTAPVKVTFPLNFDPYYPEIAFRGLSAMVPGLAAYFERMPKPYLDGGYYTKTQENRPLVGPLPVDGAFLIGAFSGFGLMVSSACGELLAQHVTGGSLPAYAPAFTLSRYDDPAYQKLLETWGDSGQL